MSVAIETAQIWAKQVQSDVIVLASKNLGNT